MDKKQTELIESIKESSRILTTLKQQKIILPPSEENRFTSISKNLKKQFPNISEKGTTYKKHGFYEKSIYPST